MSARVAAFAVVVSLLPALLIAAVAKTPKPGQSGAANVADTAVTIVTQAASGLAGPDRDSIAELAKAFSAAGLPRILPIVGLGPVTNARDLLHTRGIDMAVVDADILAYAKIDGSLPGVERHFSAIVKLGDNAIYVVAGPSVRSLTDLTGQRVLAPGQDSDSQVTARTVFALLAITIDLGSADVDKAADALASGAAKAFVITSSSGSKILGRLPQNQGLHLIPIPWTSAFADIYSPLTVSTREASGMVPQGGLETLSVASVLATFNWKAQLYRYQPVLQFVRNLPKAIANIRSGDKSSSWQSLDGRANVLGWQRFDTSERLLASVTPGEVVTATASPLAVVSPAPAVSSAAKATPILQNAPTPVPPVPPVSPSANVAASSATSRSVALATLAPPGLLTLPAPAPATPQETLEVIAYPQPGLADAKAPSGGLVADIVVASLAGQPTKLIWSTNAASAAERILESPGTRLGIAWSHPDCGVAPGLTATEAKLCDKVLFSQPLLQTLKVFFVRQGSDFTFERDEQVAGHSVCAVVDDDISDLDAPGRHWLKLDMLTLLRRSSLDGCLAALDRSEVDAVFADDFAGRAEIERLGIADHVEIVDRPVATRDMCAVAAKSDPHSADLIRRLNEGLAGLKASGRYASIVMRRFHVDQFSSRQGELR